MKALQASLAALAVGLVLTTSGPVVASGRAGPAPLSTDGGAFWRGTSGLVVEAERYIGQGKFTRLPGAWCADAVSVWLVATGRRPLRGRAAADALAYGPRVAPRPGALAVMGDRRGRAFVDLSQGGILGVYGAVTRVASGHN